MSCVECVVGSAEVVEGEGDGAEGVGVDGVGRAPQSRERREHCSRTNSNLMDNFSQNHVYSVHVLHGNCPK